MMTISDWQDEIGITFGMAKDEALEKFREWQLKKKTCQRCEGDKYVQFCLIHLICEEAQNERDAKGNDNRGRTFETDEPKALRIELSETRKRASIR
jgi:hypothetical protein